MIFEYELTKEKNEMQEKNTIDIYGTMGPSLCTQEQIYKMFQMGMNGMRLNLSHVDLIDCEEWLSAFHNAASQAGIKPKLLIDMKGPELRIGKLKEPIDLIENQFVELGNTIPVPKQVFTHAKVGLRLLLDDGRILLEVKEVYDNNLKCFVIHGGLLKSGKSLALVDGDIAMPTLTESDIRNLKAAKKFGVTGLMQPFVRNAQDLITVKQTLQSIGAEELEIFAKIENMDGVEHLEELLPYCNQIVIARGDLGNAMPLWELPAIQKKIQNICTSHHMPYMVVTQMLDSMMEHPVPTRAEVSDIFYAVYHGASSIMLTGETAAGKYPSEAMMYFVNTTKSALKFRKEEF